jgi:large subunit ribosomal protein L7/L12
MNGGLFLMKKTILLCFALLLMVVVAGCVSEKQPEVKPANSSEVEIAYEVVLLDGGDSKLEVVKEIRNNAGLDLAGSKKIVDEAPATVASGLSKEEANNLKTVLEEAGAKVEVKEIELPKSSGSEGAKTEFEVVLIDAGEKKLEVVKEIRNNTELGLTESKGIVDEAPATVASGLSKEEAEKLKTVLETAGAKVEIK